MMVGIGIDVQSIEHFSTLTSLICSDVVFTEHEHSHGQRSVAGLVPSLTGMYAAKEALLKALPRMPVPCHWGDIEVDHDGNGRPLFRTHGQLAQWMRSVGWRATPSISHSGAYVVAVAVIEQEDGC
jgi:phosphopantetheine--protein transferase-like protein